MYGVVIIHWQYAIVVVSPAKLHNALSVTVSSSVTFPEALINISFG